MVSTVRESEDTKDTGSQAAAPERRRLGLRRGTCATSTAQAPNENIPLRVSREAKAKPAWASWRHVAHSRRRPTGFAHDTHMHARAPGSPLPASAWAQMRSRELTRASDRIREWNRLSPCRTVLFRAQEAKAPKAYAATAYECAGGRKPSNG